MLISSCFLVIIYEILALINLFSTKKIMVMLHVFDIQNVHVINYRDDWLGHFRQSRKHFIFKKGSSLDNPSSPHGTPNCHFLGIFCFPDPRVLFADAAVESRRLRRFCCGMYLQLAVVPRSKWKSLCAVYD